jgi:hypothetical protein
MCEDFWAKKAVLKMRKRKKEKVFKYFNRKFRSALEVIKLLDCLQLWEARNDLKVVDNFEIDEWKKVVLRALVTFLHLNEQRMFLKDLLKMYKENCSHEVKTEDENLNNFNE